MATKKKISGKRPTGRTKKNLVRLTVADLKRVWRAGKSGRTVRLKIK